MASFRIEDILARPHGSRSGESSGAVGVPAIPVPSYQQLSFGVDQILGRHETEQRERHPLLGKKKKESYINHCCEWASNEFPCTHAHVLINPTIINRSRLLIFTALCGKYQVYFTPNSLVNVLMAFNKYE